MSLTTFLSFLPPLLLLLNTLTLQHPFSLITTVSAVKPKPNIVFILTDDQDIVLDGMETMTQTKELIVNKGITFSNAFVTSPICCISRSSIITGRYMHNTQVYNNSINGGCSSSTFQSDMEPYTYAVAAKNAGYLTFYAGKYLNQYGGSEAGGVSHIPQGWTRWYGLVGNSQYYHYSVSDQGTEVFKNYTYQTDYFTDVINRQAVNWLKNISNMTESNYYDGLPILMVLATPAAHAPFTPAPQYMNTSKGEIAPRTPSWNVTGSKNDRKHELLRQVPPLTDLTANQSDSTWRLRHGTLRSVDDMIAAVYSQLETMGLINNTYWIYTSDHGFHLGQFGMGYDKRQLYDYDLRVPFYISGPGIPEGVTTDIVALNIDIAPTIAEIVSENIPEYMDGRSLKEYLFDSTYHIKNNNGKKFNNNNKQSSGLFQQFMVEYEGEGASGNASYITMCGGVSGYETTVCDSWNNTYQCVRTIDGTKGEINGTIYCTFKCFDAGKNIVDCGEGTPESEGEYYDMDTDPWQLDNLWLTLNGSDIEMYEDAIENLLKCGGQTECNQLRGDDASNSNNDIQKMFNKKKKVIKMDKRKKGVM